MLGATNDTPGTYARNRWSDLWILHCSYVSLGAILILGQQTQAAQQRSFAGQFLMWTCGMLFSVHMEYWTGLLLGGVPGHTGYFSGPSQFLWFPDDTGIVSDHIRDNFFQQKRNTANLSLCHRGSCKKHTATENHNKDVERTIHRHTGPNTAAHIDATPQHNMLTELSRHFL